MNLKSLDNSFANRCPRFLCPTPSLLRMCRCFPRTSPTRCFVKAKTLPEDMEAELTAVHGKHRPSGSAAPAGGPVLGRADKESVDLLAKTLTSMSSRVHEAQEKSYGVDTELTEMLAALGITAGEPADAAAVRAAEVWATVEDQPDVVEAMQQDAVDEMTELLDGTAPAEESSDDEASEEPSSHMAPPPYAVLSSHFGALETAAEGSGNRDAAFHLQKAKMAMIAAHGSKAARQTDMRQFL